MNPEDKINDIINSLGATAELLSVFRDKLIDAGFEPDEALELCGVMLQTIIEHGRG